MGKHMITLYISIKLLEFSTWKITEYIRYVQKEQYGRGSAPQEQSDWEKPLEGVLKSVCLKWTESFFFSLADLLEALSSSSLIVL